VPSLFIVSFIFLNDSWNHSTDPKYSFLLTFISRQKWNNSSEIDRFLIFGVRQYFPNIGEKFSIVTSTPVYWEMTRHNRHNGLLPVPTFCGLVVYVADLLQTCYGKSPIYYGFATGKLLQWILALRPR